MIDAHRRIEGLPGRSVLVLGLLWVLVGGAIASAAEDHDHFQLDLAHLEAALTATSDTPIRCGTFLIHAAEQRRDELSPAALRALDQMTLPRALDQFYETPEGHFVIEYSISGNDSVPVTDDDENGVPDYVEWVAEAMEESWATEIDQLGFAEIPLGPGERYRVLLPRLGSTEYGRTLEVGSAPGGTIMWINGDFESFFAANPALVNEDPDGPIRGAIRVTAAHELKHSIQYVRSIWSEFSDSPGWLELDATFMEDIVYDEVNDYYFYTDDVGSPFISPTLSLTRASYEDSTWQHFLDQRYGLDLILDFWARRGDRRFGETVGNSYIWAIDQAGIDLAALWGEYQSWNYLSGSRSTPTLGFEEGDRYPTAATEALSGSFPETVDSVTLRGWASRYHQIGNAGRALEGGLSLRFDGANIALWSVGIVLQNDTESLIFPVMLEAGVGSLTVDNENLADFDRAAILVGNAGLSQAFASYEFTVDLVEVGPPPGPTFAFSRMTANPAAAGSDIQFALRLPRDGRLAAHVYDLRGRRVRTLLAGEERSAGAQPPLAFDGRNDGGELLAAGVYVVALDYGGSLRTTKVVLVD